MDMKTVFLSAAAGALAAAAGAATAAAAQPGDPREAVLAELGAPAGQIRLESVELLYYDRGTVRLTNGVVAEAKLVSPEQAAELRAKREAEAAARRQAEAELRERRIAEGTNELARLLSDAAFLTSTPDRQVAVWQDFMKRYPEVNVSRWYVDALARHQQQVRDAQQQQRLAELEWRTRQAEARAEAAEDEARRARSRPVVVYAPPYWPYVQPGPRAESTRVSGTTSGLSIQYRGSGLNVEYTGPTAGWPSACPWAPASIDPLLPGLPPPAVGPSISHETGIRL